MTEFRTGLAMALFAGALAAFGQETPPAAPESSPTPETKEARPFRPIEANVIIALPSVDVPAKGTLTFLVTHRFTQRIQDGDIENFFTLDSGNDWGFGLWYAPFEKLNLGFYRASDFATYEASGQYQLPSLGCFSSSLRFGADWRTSSFAASPKSSLFAQAMLAYDFGKYARLTVVPTYLQRTNGTDIDFDPPLPVPPGDQSCRPSGNPLPLPQVVCSGLYENVFNVPVALSIALTHSITIHGEVYPRLAEVNSDGVGWSVTVEKSLLRHRFAFFAGSQRQTTVDRYTQAIPYGRNPKNIYIGFNLFRAWKL